MENNLPQNCSICNDIIDPERIAALKELNIMSKDFLCLKCAELNTKRVKGFYNGFSGANLVICDGISEESGIDRGLN